MSQSEVKCNGPFERILIQVLVEESEILDSPVTKGIDLGALLKAWDQISFSKSYITELSTPSGILRSIINANITSKNFISYYDRELEFITDVVNKRARSLGIEADLFSLDYIRSLLAFNIKHRVNHFCGFLPNTHKVDVFGDAFSIAAYYIWFESHIENGWSFQSNVQYDQESKKSQLLTSYLEAHPRILKIFRFIAFLINDILGQLESDPRIPKLIFLQDPEYGVDCDIKDDDCIAIDDNLEQ